MLISTLQVRVPVRRRDESNYFYDGGVSGTFYLYFSSYYWKGIVIICPDHYYLLLLSHPFTIAKNEECKSNDE